MCGESEARNARERARYAIDKTGVDKNGNGKADRREGKDIEHVVPLSKGGTNKKSNLRIETPAHPAVYRSSRRRRGRRVV